MQREKKHKKLEVKHIILIAFIMFITFLGSMQGGFTINSFKDLCGMLILLAFFGFPFWLFYLFFIATKESVKSFNTSNKEDDSQK